MNSLSNHEPDSNSWISPKSEIRISPIGGKGLFAKEEIIPGEEVVIWKGIYTNKEGSEEAKAAGKLVMQWDENLFSVEDRGDDDGYFINHSCDSNLWMKDAYTLVARRAIKAGEEITADYALWESDENYISKWECNCKTKDCRKKITGKDWQLKNVQEKYKEHFSPLINKKINSAKLYIMTGLPYAGKSTLTKELVSRFGFEVVSVDRKIREHQFDTATMTQNEWNLVYSEAYEYLEELLKNGKTVVFDMGHLEKSERNTARGIAAKANVTAILIYVNVPLEVIKARRIKNIETNERGHLEDESMAKALNMFEPPTEDEHAIIYSPDLNLDNWIKEHITFS